MAVRGEFSWPSAGNSGGRPRGILMAAYGEIAMAVDSRWWTLWYPLPKSLLDWRFHPNQLD